MTERERKREIERERREAVQAYLIWQDTLFNFKTSWCFCETVSMTAHLPVCFSVSVSAEVAICRSSLCVQLYVRITVRVRIFNCLHTHACQRRCVCVCVCVCVCLPAYVGAHVCVCLCTHMLVCTAKVHYSCARMFVSACVCVRLLAYQNVALICS